MRTRETKGSQRVRGGRRGRGLAALTFLPLLLAMMGAPGCGGGTAVRVDCDYGYEKDALSFRLSASPDLNLYNNQPHTVVLVFYALSDPNSFNQLLESSDGIGRLLEGKRFDASALSPRQIVVQPGEQKELVMDRVQGTRYVGVVGGFYNQQAQNFSRLFTVPTKKLTTLFGKEKACVTEPLAVELVLGSDGFAAAGEAKP